MKTEPLVSIIINNYNYERFLAEVIDSALNQTYSNTQVIVVDDCSTDNSREIIASYGDRITPVLHEVNGKQGAAFNSGFAKSQGDIIIFLDSDDSLYPQAVDAIVAIWKPGLAKIHYRLNVIDVTGQPRGFSYPQGTNRLADGKVWKTLLRTGTYKGVPTSGNALSRQALIQVMPIASEYATTSDDYLSVLIPLYGEVVAIEKPLGSYRLHDCNQWALTSLTDDRFRRFVHHDLQRCQLLKQRAPDLGYEIPEDLYFRFFGRAWSRLISLRLDPDQHPVPSDHPLPLIYYSIVALWKYTEFALKKRLLFSLWVVWIGLMPLPFARPAIVWLYTPQARPNPMKWVLAKFRLLQAEISN